MAHNSLFPFWRESAQFKFACLLDRIDRIFESSSSMGSAQGGGTRLTEAQRLDIIHELGRPDHRSRAAIAASYGVTPKAVRVLWANRAAVLDRCAGKTPAYLDATSCYHAPKHPALEILLHEWLVSMP